MKKVFISQAMNGKTQATILAERAEAIGKAKEIFGEIEVIDSYFEDYNPEKGCVPLKYLAKSLELMADADIVFFAKGWREARGCRIEFECAKAYGIHQCSCDGWIDK